MRRNVGVHGVDHGDVVHVLADLIEHLAHRRAALTHFLEPELRGQRHSADRFHVLIRMLGQRGFVIPRVQMRRRTLREDMNHPLGFGGKLRFAGPHGVGHGGGLQGGTRVRRGGQIRQHRGQPHGTHAHA